MVNSFENGLQEQKSIDLHMHSVKSDGDLTPIQVVKQMKKQGLEVIALTDHDTIDGIEQAIRAGKYYGIKVIPGVEITTKYDKQGIHILGYYIDTKNKKLNWLLEKIKGWRKIRVKKMLEKLNSAGIALTWEDVAKQVKGSFSKRHIAKAMAEKGYANSTKEAINNYFKKGKIAYVEVNSLSPQEVIKFVLEAGGVPVLAHPGEKNIDEGLIVKLIKAGLEGIEVYTPKHNQEQISYYKSLAEKYGLLTTKGSDFHG